MEVRVLTSAESTRLISGVLDMGGQSCLLITECERMCKVLFNAQKCNYGETVPKKSHFENSHSLAISSSTVHLREVILALSTLKWVLGSLMRGAHLREVRNVEF